MPSPDPVINRRSVLAGGAALSVLGTLGGILAACGNRTPTSKQPTVEDLHGPFDQARSDSALATAAAAAVGLAPQTAAALTVVATQRAAHATALAAEIFRVAGKPTSSTSESTSPTPNATSTEPAPPPPAVSDVINALRTSAESASHLVTTSSGYRAGLLGSIGASCTAAYTVALVPGGPSI